MVVLPLLCPFMPFVVEEKNSEISDYKVHLLSNFKKEQKKNRRGAGLEGIL